MWIFRSLFLLWNRSYQFIFRILRPHCKTRTRWPNREKLTIVQRYILRWRFRRRRRRRSETPFYPANTSAREKVTFREVTHHEGKKNGQNYRLYSQSNLFAFFFFRIFIFELVGGTSCSWHQCKSFKHLTSNLIPPYNKQPMPSCICVFKLWITFWLRNCEINTKCFRALHNSKFPVLSSAICTSSYRQ